MTKTDTQLASEWFLIDAAGRRLGQVAAATAALLRGKHRVDFAPHRLPPVHVVVVNTDRFDIPQKKLGKAYRHHSQYLGHLKSELLGARLTAASADVLRDAVGGMLARNRLRQKFLLRLHPYANTEHPYQDKTFITPSHG